MNIGDIKNIHCLALNYGGVGLSDEKPLYFVKSHNSLTGNNSIINFPENTEELWTEVEICIILAKDCNKISVDKAKNFIKGITVACDLTRKNIHGRDHHLGYSKSLSGFCPILNEDYLCLDELDLNNIKLETQINGKITQQGSSSEMIYNIYESLSFISSFTNLKKNDIILTGTPSGVENNLIKKGDSVISKLNNLTLNFSIK
tara:strand:+ start:1575 stop:2183 length:609 start_codon:yes stop_codon:yes gene_type:complete